MDLRRRDFIRAGGGWLLSLAARPLRAQAERPAGPAPEPRVVLTWGTNGHAEGQFDIPIAIVIDRKDEILITDFRQSDPDAKGRLQRFDPSGRFLEAFELEPMPGGLALDEEGLLYATHMMRHTVAVYDRMGRRVREFGRPGTAPGEFQQPGGVAFGPDGSVYVADQVNRRVQKFKPDGTFLLAWGDNEIGPGHFGSPGGLQGPIAVAVGSNDRVWITATNHYVQRFTVEGRYVCRVGGLGSEPGQFRTPHGLAFDSHDHLYVVDSRNSRIQKLAI